MENLARAANVMEAAGVMPYVDNLNWPGAALAYGGYRAGRAAYNRVSNYRRDRRIDSMYGKRPSSSATWIPGRDGRHAPFKRARYGQKTMYKPRLSKGGRQSNAGTKYVVLKDLHGPWGLGSGDSPQQFKPADMINCPAWGYFKKCYKSAA